MSARPIRVIVPFSAGSTSDVLARLIAEALAMGQNLVLGVPDMDAAMKKVKDFTLAGVAERIACPTLLCHGERDRLATMETAQQLYNAVGAKDRTLKIFTAEEGGVDHCQVDNRQVGRITSATGLA